MKKTKKNVLQKEQKLQKILELEKKLEEIQDIDVLLERILTETRAITIIYNVSTYIKYSIHGTNLPPLCLLYHVCQYTLSCHFTCKSYLLASIVIISLPF